MRTCECTSRTCARVHVCACAVCTHVCWSCCGVAVLLELLQCCCFGVCVCVVGGANAYKEGLALEGIMHHGFEFRFVL